ncbi:TPA: hypothetical protein ACLFZ1_001440 [Serratia marcescens]|nr:MULTISPECIES: hypothetical protein [Serratia]NGD66444.1 hypothetical protein [Serratia marcescens]WRV72549.1 hypothetical protein VOT21_19490 [Serratia sp. K-M0252]HBC5194010.1 hypothetical protein [Serratia marcescens]
MIDILSMLSSKASAAFSRAKETRSGIKVTGFVGNGFCGFPTVITYSDAVKQLDSGKFDGNLIGGLSIVSAIHQGGIKGWYQPNDEQMMLVWRWTIACLFILELEQKRDFTLEATHGIEEHAAVYASNQGDKFVYPSSERFSLAAFIEDMAIDKFGYQQGIKMAMMIYGGMTENSSKGGGLILSQWGKAIMGIIHDRFLEKEKKEVYQSTMSKH